MGTQVLEHPSSCAAGPRGAGGRHHDGHRGGVKRLVYITSPSYSGSTLLTLLMGSHPEIVTVGEMKARAMGDIDAYACSCGTRIRQCGFWRRVAEGMKKRGHPFDVGAFGLNFEVSEGGLIDRAVQAGVRGPLLELARQVLITLWPGCEHRLLSVVQRNEVFADVLREITGRPVVVDGSKDPIRLLHLLRSREYEIRAIHLVRDGRGVVTSFRRHEKYGIARGSQEFVRAHREAERVRAMMPADRTMRLIYEDLCAHPAERMRDVYAFVGVDPDSAPAELGAQEFHVIGNSMRLQRLSEIRCDTKWKTELGTDELQTFEREAGKVNRHYGYE